MKPIALTISAVIALTLGLTTVSHAQVQRPNNHRRHAASTTNPQALAALQTDLQNAITSMTSALPIYDGNRVRSIHAAHRALILVDKAISGNRALVRPKPTVRDHIASGKAKGKFSAQQIAASQAAMQQGLAALTQAQADLTVAAGTNPGKRAYEVNNHLKTAVAEANAAINLHGGATNGSLNTGVRRPGNSAAGFQP
jgi:hypothetical protein